MLMFLREPGELGFLSPEEESVRRAVSKSVL
jgi:hypothetical protein